MINNSGGLIAAKQKQLKKIVQNIQSLPCHATDFHSYKFYDPNLTVSWHNYVIRQQATELMGLHNEHVIR